MTKPRFYVTGDSEDTMEAHRLNRRVQRMDQRRLEAEPAVGSLEHPVHRLDKPTASATARHERGEQVFFVAMRVDDVGRADGEDAAHLARNRQERVRLLGNDDHRDAVRRDAVGERSRVQRDRRHLKAWRALESGHHQEGLRLGARPKVSRYEMADSHGTRCGGRPLASSDSTPRGTIHRGAQ